MSIERYYDTTFTITRMSWSGDSSALVSSGSFTGHIQQADQRLVEDLRSAFTISHSIWCDDATDVQAGDTLTEGSNTYSVKAIQTNDHAGKNKHKEVLVEKDL